MEKQRKRQRKGRKFKLNCLVMESPFQVSLILYLDSIECVPRGKKERLNPSIRSGKGAQSSSLRDRLARLQCRSVNTQDASRPHRPLHAGLGTHLSSEGACRRKLAHKVIARSPRKCKTVPLPRGGTRPQVHSPFENVVKLCILLPETYSHIRDFAKILRGFKDFMCPTHTLHSCLKTWRTFLLRALLLFTCFFLADFPGVKTLFFFFFFLM